MSRLLLAVGFAACAGFLLGMPARPVAAAPPVKAEDKEVEDVRKAIDKGVRYLKGQQSKQGDWEGYLLENLAGMDGGQTALATLALLNCGVKPDDPAVKRALDFLENLEPKRTYVVGLSNLVFAEVGRAKYLPKIQANADWLVKHGIGWTAADDRTGLRVNGVLRGWSYPRNNVTAGSGDNSNTQYALLGLYAAKQAGAKIHDSVWQGIQKYYSDTQDKMGGGSDGSWPYLNAVPGASMSMTVAGVCGLLIARMGLDQSDQVLDPLTGKAAKCGVYKEDDGIARGMRWIARSFNFDSPLNATFYNIYGVERLGRLSGQRFIGKHDWYREGCKKLVAIQAADGSFGSAKGYDSVQKISTSFSLLFLSKGRTPVLISKFAWGTLNEGVEIPALEEKTPKGAVNWNRKHHDTSHVVEFCSKELFKGAPLSWQVYDARRLNFGNDGQKTREEVGILLQSPVLYMNGHGPIKDTLTDAQRTILKTYIDEGGFIVAEACCGDPKFAESFRDLIKELFGSKPEKMRPEHPIWGMFPGVTSLDFPDLEALEYGCRTAVVFSPSPLAGYWEETKYMPKDSKNPANRGEKSYCLARNVVAYATGMEMPKPKLSRQKLEQADDKGTTRSRFQALQLQPSLEETPPAPGALKNLMAYLRDNARLDVAMTNKVLLPGDADVFDYKFLYMHGRMPVAFDGPTIKNLRSTLNTGGLLLADAACGGYKPKGDDRRDEFKQWKEFDKSFREMCARLYPEGKLVVIQPTGDDGKEDPLFKIAREAGIDLTDTRCRRELPNGKGAEPAMRSYPVLLEGIKDKNGRWVVIYSKYDVGCAIEGHKSAECLGYDKDSALRIAAAVALYSLKR